jgi:hypothetical protein
MSRNVVIRCRGHHAWEGCNMELNAREAMVLNQLNQLVKNGTALQQAIADLRMMIQDDDLVTRVAAEREEIVRARSTIFMDTALLDPEEMPPPWYLGPDPSDRFWPKLRDTLLSDPDWSQAVKGLDATSTTIVSALADPHSPKIATRGLVLGYVQSGKTANFTATIAKAADAGYRLFIVLSGVHNTLRRQTQIRLDEQLCDLNPADWVQLTDEERDFGNPVKAFPLVAGSQLKLIAVVKKNVSRMTSLRAWLETAHKQGGLDNCPVLIIDDEADQASVNSHRDPELDRTRINEELVALLKLPRVAYVGYTATPFANVLVNPDDVSDIYPRHFIFSLPKPEGYFGAEELFAPGLNEHEAEGGRAPFDLIRTVPDNEATAYAVRPKAQFVPVLTPSLHDAIRWFILATAARRLRSGTKKHSSMLIHTTVRVIPQLQYVELVKTYITDLRKQVQAGHLSSWKSQWDAEVERQPAERFGLQSLTFAELAPSLGDVLAEAKVVADNSGSDERLLYSDDPATVIAIGGNTLSRGLTLHGLVSSYFLRTANTYDSVLQMGRWFGYRPGYADLPRVWTTSSLEDDFRFLSEVESDIRKDIDRYVGGHRSPRDLAVRILLHPRMKVTSRLRMHFAVAASASYSEHRPQTTYFAHKDAAGSNRNLALVTELLTTKAASSFEHRPSFVTAADFPVSTVLTLLNGFNFHASSDMADGTLVKYIEDQNERGALHSWNVAIVTRQSSKNSMALGNAGRVNLITRSRLSASPDPLTANIGTLASRQDRLADLTGYGLTPENTDAEIQSVRNTVARPLLLVYPIDKSSMPVVKGKYRVGLDASEHQIGLSIIFPTAAPGSEDRDKIQVDLRALTPEELEEGADQPAYVDDEGTHDEVKLDE